MTEQPNIYKIQLDNILAVMSSRTFSRGAAIHIVGGSANLNKLISEGKIEADKRSPAQQGKWFCNAAQVLMHCRDMRPRNKKQTQPIQNS